MHRAPPADEDARPRLGQPRPPFAVRGGAVLYGATTLRGAQVGVRATRERRDEAVRRRLEACGQGHVFRFWSRLDPAERERLLDQVETIDLPALQAALECTA